MARAPFLPSGFEYRRMDVDGVTINFAVAGSGPPLLLLHGYPQNHLMWRHVAPVLARDHTVVLADLRGYGDSGKPAPDDAGRVYSKRSMARDQVGLMRQLGFGPFQLVGHDRGARVSHRLILDHPGAVTRLAVLDIVPTRHVLHNVTRAMATAYYHWFFLPVGNGVPEHLIGADPAYWIRSLIGPLLGKGASIEPAVMDDYIRCFSDPGTIAGSCADYRSAASIDLGSRRRDLRRRAEGRVPGSGAVGDAGLRRPRLRAAQRLAGVRHRRARRSAAHRSLPARRSARPGQCRPARLPRLAEYLAEQPVREPRHHSERSSPEVRSPGSRETSADSIGPMATVDLAHDDVGDGPAVVLIHGHPFNRSMWAPQLAALRDQFRVIAPDLRGYGGSPVTPGTVPMARLAADVSHLLDGKGIAAAALAGLSMGGLVVMELAAAQPERWWAYGFIATTAQRVTQEELQARRASARAMEGHGMRPVAEQMAARLFGAEPGSEVTAAVMAMMLATSPAGAAAAVRGRAERPDYHPVLRSLRAPALVCTGDRDSYSTARVTAELVSCLHDPEVVLMDGVGHLPNLERPGDFNERLLDFLTRARPR